MDKVRIRNYLKRSKNIGILYCILESAVQLICGLCISGGLEFALQSRWEDVRRILPVTGVLLVVGTVSLFYCAKLRNKKKAEDQFAWKQSIRQGILDGEIKVAASGELEVKLSKDAKCISEYYQDALPKAVSSSLIMTICLILLCAINWKIGVSFLAMNALQMIPTVLYEKYTKAIYESTHENEEDYEDWILEGYRGLKTLKSYRQEEWFLKRYEVMQKNMISSGMRAERTATVENIVFEAIAALLNYGSYVILGLFVLAGEIDMAQTPMLLILARNLFRTMLPVFDLRIKNFEYQSACRRLGFTDGGKERAVLTGEPTAVLTVQNLSKAYGEKTVISHLSFQVKEKEKVLLKGRNGSGKTTLILLLLGFEDAEEGKICYGADRETFDYCLQEEPDWNDSGCILAKEMEQAESL